MESRPVQFYLRPLTVVIPLPLQLFVTAELIAYDGLNTQFSTLSENEKSASRWDNCFQ
jgi:hypothetical protein